MNVILIIPTGIGAEIGGHAGDANPVCKLIASVAETVVTHPNVVNASDINEMPDNVLYVEGSMLDDFLSGEIRLRQPLQNRILVVANSPLGQDTVNAVEAARVTIGIDAYIVPLKTPLRMVAGFEDGRATGVVFGAESLVEQVRGLKFGALAIHTPIEVPREVAIEYFKSAGVNPWGGVEAVASRMIARALNKPVAHAPQETVTPDDPELWGVLYQEIDARMAPEAIASTYLHCVLKGLNRAPQAVPVRGLGMGDIDALIVPDGCFGVPQIECLEVGIPVIVVRENQTIYKHDPHPSFIVVENYWEAAGVLMCMKAGIAPGSVRR